MKVDNVLLPPSSHHICSFRRVCHIEDPRHCMYSTVHGEGGGGLHREPVPILDVDHIGGR